MKDKPQTENVQPEPPPTEAGNTIEVNENEYGGENVRIFKDAAHIRARPGMYIGDSSYKGLHQLVYELVHNSVDEALAGHCKNISIIIGVDNSCAVADDGRGIPVEEHHEAKKSTLEVVMTTVGAGAKFDKNAYKVSAGLHGIGAKAVTALSEWVEAEVRRNGRVYVQEYERGKAITEVMDRGASGNTTGTRIKFKPDPEIFHEATLDFDTLESRLRELAFLNKGLGFRLVDERTQREEIFKYAGGIAEYAEYLNRLDDVLHKPIYIEKRVPEHNMYVEVAMQYTTAEEERIRCYANNAFNSMGGTHQVGFRTALTRTLNAYGQKENLFKNVEPKGEDFREGLTAIISVHLPEPQLEAQTKVRLNNPEVEGIVASVVNEVLAKYLEEHPKDALRILKKVILAAEAREAAAKAKKALKDRKNILSGGGLPGKLMDCTSRDRENTELFLVEGDSAGGSAESGRERMYQAILPLRGKPLNVEKSRLEKLLANDELCSIISAVGIDIGNSDNIEGLRYDKIVILTDADVDGQHIRTLLLTFFYRQMRKLIEDGHIFVARPPLFKISQRKQVRYIQTTDEITQELQERGLNNTKVILLPADKTQQELVVEKQQLAQLLKVLADLEHELTILERSGINLDTLLKRAVNGKLPLFRVLFAGQESWYFTREEMDTYRNEQQKKLGRELVVAQENLGNSNGQKANDEIIEQERHEIRNVNRGLEKLREFRLQPEALLPAQRIAGREPAPRFTLESGEARKQLPHLRCLVNEVRLLGEKGLTITRFKGLGEMDGEELWETTLDPKKRTLLQVHMDDALKADEMFRTLMGEKVEPRREFIQKHALEVKEIDYHGA